MPILTAVLHLTSPETLDFNFSVPTVFNGEVDQFRLDTRKFINFNCCEASTLTTTGVALGASGQVGYLLGSGIVSV